MLGPPNSFLSPRKIHPPSSNGSINSVSEWEFTNPRGPPQEFGTTRFHGAQEFEEHGYISAPDYWIKGVFRRLFRGDSIEPNLVPKTISISKALWDDDIWSDLTDLRVFQGFETNFPLKKSGSSSPSLGTGHRGDPSHYASMASFVGIPWVYHNSWLKRIQWKPSTLGKLEPSEITVSLL